MIRLVASLRRLSPTAITVLEYCQAFSLSFSSSSSNSSSSKRSPDSIFNSWWMRNKKTEGECSQSLSDVQKYMMIRRRSIETNGRIPDLKGIEVRDILANTSRSFLKDIMRVETSDLIRLLLVDPVAMKGNQEQLLNLLASKASEMPPQQRLFLAKTAVFARFSEKCKAQLNQVIISTLASISESKSHTNAFSKIIYMVTFYQHLRTGHPQLGRVQEMSFCQLPISEQKRVEAHMRRLINPSISTPSSSSTQLLYESTVESILNDSNTSPSQLVLLLNELIYLGLQQDSPLVKTVIDKIDTKDLSRSQLMEVITLTTARGIETPQRIYMAFKQLFLTAVEGGKESESSLEAIPFSSLPDRRSLTAYLLEDQLMETQRQAISGAPFELSTSELVDGLWVLIRNFEENDSAFHEKLLKELSKQMKSLQIRHLLSLLHSFIGWQMHRNVQYLSDSNRGFDEFREVLDVKQLVKCLEDRVRMSEKSLNAKQECALHLNLRYLVGSKQMEQSEIGIEFARKLQEKYQQLTIGKNYISETERKVLKSLQQLKEEGKIQVTAQPGVLLQNLYYVDFFFPPDKVLEVNGDFHMNKQTQYAVQQNYLLKLFVLKFAGTHVEILQSQQYLPLIHNHELFHAEIVKVLDKLALTQM